MLDKSQRYKYQLQSAQGKDLTIYGIKSVPFTFDNIKIYIKVIICDVTLPLMSTSDMVNRGISVLLDKNEPYLKVNGRKFKLLHRNKHFWMQQNYIKEGIFGVTQNTHVPTQESTNPSQIFLKQYPPKLKGVPNRENNDVSKDQLQTIERGDNCKVVREHVTTSNHIPKKIPEVYQVGYDNVPGSSTGVSTDKMDVDEITEGSQEIEPINKKVRNEK